MTEIDHSIAQSAVQEQTVTVSPGHNTLSISLRDHSWVSISDGDEEIAGNYTPVPIFRLSVSPGTYTIRSDGVIEQVSSEFMQPVFSPFEQLQQGLPAQLYLTSDAPDQHIVDGVGEIPADGTSFCTITVETVALDGTPLSGQAQEGEVFLRTTGGVLLDAAGENRIRSVTLKSGRAAFRLVAEASPKVVTVTAFGQGPALLKAEIQIEFV
jgi:hypothetical protein